MPDTTGLIRIDGHYTPTKKNGKPVSVEDFWKDYYESRDESLDVLRQKLGILNAHKKFRDVKAILFGYLKAHPNQSAPWMYEALAIAIKLNGGDEKDIHQSLNFAADLALQTKNPNPIISVADQLLIIGYLDRVGELLDTASEMIPHRGEPILMSINLAKKQKDPKRMGDSIDRLLSLGWPMVDDTVRRDARKQAEQLAKVRKEEGRDEEADALIARLPESEARDLFIRLTWIGDADLDLAIDEPLGATARYQTPRTVFGGSIVKNGYGTHPEEVYVCPRAFDGEYVIKVDTVYNNPAKPAIVARLEIIQHEGTSDEHKEVKTIKIGKETAEPVKITLKGGRRKQVLPFVDPNALSTTVFQELAKTVKKKETAEPKASQTKNEAKTPASRNR